MARRSTATIEDVFDDDTDLPLPSRPLAHLDPKRAVLQSIDSDSDDDDGLDRGQQSAGPASPPQMPPAGFGMSSPPSGTTVSDMTPYKQWTCVYPIYIDAKRPCRTGLRRVPRSKSVWWPLSKDIADAANRLGLGTLHEVNKCHPADWDNPGRVRVQWRRDGVLLNPGIRSKKELLATISLYIQSVKPELVPKPEDEALVGTKVDAKIPKQAANKSKANQGKKGKQVNSIPLNASGRRRLPQPPDSQCLSQYSPALPSGVLVETIKAGMNASADAPAPPAGAGGKGKRKVVRVRA